MGNGTPLGRVRGLGSAKSGVHHWISQRMTALANALLGSWLFVTLITTDFSSHTGLTRWLAKPLAAVPMILLIVSVLWHIRLGLQVLIEDYVHSEALKLALLVLLNLFVVGAGVFGVFAVASIAFGAPNAG